MPPGATAVTARPLGGEVSRSTVRPRLACRSFWASPTSSIGLRWSPRVRISAATKSTASTSRTVRPEMHLIMRVMFSDRAYFGRLTRSLQPPRGRAGAAAPTTPSPGNLRFLYGLPWSGTELLQLPGHLVAARVEAGEAALRAHVTVQPDQPAALLAVVRDHLDLHPGHAAPTDHAGRPAARTAPLPSPFPHGGVLTH